MQRFTRSVGILAIVLGAVSPARAAIITFVGEDLNPNENMRLDVHPNATAAQAAFLAQLLPNAQGKIANFQLIGRGTQPQNLPNEELPITFSAPGLPTDTAFLQGTGIVNGPDYTDAPAPLADSLSPVTYVGRFSIHPETSPLDAAASPPPGGHYYDSQDTFSLTFSSPQSAFGFYATDVNDQDGNLFLSLDLLDGLGDPIAPARDIEILPAVADFTIRRGNVVYFAVIDTDLPFNRVRFHNEGLDAETDDFFGFDDFTIARADQLVPEPSSLMMFGLGLMGLVGCTWRRRGRPVAG